MNFISTFDELNKLYEEAVEEPVKVEEEAKEEPEVVEEACAKEALTEAADDEEIEIVDDAEVPVEEPVEEGEPRQLICECDKCGALVIKAEADVVADEESGLVDVDAECQFCEEAKGYKIVGVVAPYEVAEEEPVEDEEIFEEAVEVAGDATYKNYIPAFKKIAEAVDGKFDFMGNLVVDGDRIIMTINRDINKNELKQVLDAMSATQTCKENRWEAVYTGMKADKNVIIQFEPKR